MPTKSIQQQIYYPQLNEKKIEHNNFPSSRYFQIHFEYIESQLKENKQSIDMLQQQVAELNMILSLILLASNDSKEKK
jgi:hypothetical protein